MKSPTAATSTTTAAPLPTKNNGFDLALDGVRLLLTNQFKNAEKFFDEQADNEPKIALLHSLLKYGNAISSYSEEDMQAALSSAKRTLERGEKLEKAAKKDELHKKIEGKLLQADALLIQSLIQLVLENYVKMMWNMRKSYNEFLEVQKLLEKYNGVNRDELTGWCKYGVGIFNLVLSLLPPSILKLAEVIGYEGSKSVGLRLLTECQQSPVFMAPFASLLLLAFYVTVSSITGDEDLEGMSQARQLLDWANEKYPGGAFFALMESRYCRCVLETRKAIEIADKGVQQVTELPSITVLFHYQKAWCSFFLLDWVPCAESFDALLHSTLNGDYVPPNGERKAQKPGDASVAPTQASAQALYAYQVGLCYGMAGDFHKAEWYLRSVDKWLLKSPKEIELWGKRKATELVSRKRQVKEDYLLDVFELMHAWNGYTQMPAEALQQAEQMLLDAEAKAKSGAVQWSLEDSARCMVQLAAIRSSTKRYQEAYQPLNAFVQTQKEFLKSTRAKKSGFSPVFYYELANTTFQLALTTQGPQGAALEEQAKEYQKKAAKYDDYDLEKMLQIRVHSLKRKMKEREDATAAAAKAAKKK